MFFVAARMEGTVSWSDHRNRLPVFFPNINQTFLFSILHIAYWQLCLSIEWQIKTTARISFASKYSLKINSHKPTFIFLSLMTLAKKFFLFHFPQYLRSKYRFPFATISLHLLCMFSFYQKPGCFSYPSVTFSLDYGFLGTQSICSFKQVTINLLYRMVCSGSLYHN